MFKFLLCYPDLFKYASVLYNNNNNNNYHKYLFCHTWKLWMVSSVITRNIVHAFVVNEQFGMHAE